MNDAANPSGGLVPPLLIEAQILALDFTDLPGSIERAVAAGVDRFHIDVMDGHFVPNLSVGPDVAAAIRKLAGDVPVHVHLQVREPRKYLRQLTRAGMSYFSFHLEVTKEPKTVIRAVRREGMQVGVVLNPITPPTEVDEILGEIDYVVLMTVNPGFAGQILLPNIKGKIRTMRELIGPEKDLCVEGGINPRTVGEVSSSGANVLVAGSSIFRVKDPAAALHKLRVGYRARPYEPKPM